MYRFFLIGLIVLVSLPIQIHSGEKNNRNKTVVVDSDTGIMWQKKRVGKKMNWSDAKSYCNKLSFEGHDDWRLPAKSELLHILGGCKKKTEKYLEGNCNACKKSSKCSSMFPADMEWYWTSTESTDNSNLAWRVSFYNGFVSSSSKTGKRHLRCVRDGQ